MLAKVGAYLFAKLATEQFIKRVVLVGARYLATKTENTLDDELVSALEDALK